MNESFLGKGWRFPVAVDSATGKIAVSTGEEDIRQSIWLILSTAQGERAMRPDFGCGIHDLVFESMGGGVIGDLESDIRQALIRFEPRIEVVNFEVSTEEANRGQLLIDLTFRVRETNNEFNMVYPFFLTEGN